MLEEAGGVVRSAASLEETKAILGRESEAFDIAVIKVCLDECDLDNEDGMRVAEYIVNTGQRINIVMLTGYGTVAHCRRAFKDLKVFDFLQKERLDFSDGFLDIVAQAIKHQRGSSGQSGETPAL